jgi:DNA ligase D-like protein (predicted ligase)/DNA ligase D-like protein (predicted 3'-phosphoesterase)
LFVVHKHAATRLHWDLRIEMDGVLRSWAVPKGPSYDMNDKRLAVNVEDHPLEYGDFEGIIPSGNYGAGGIIVWDRGEWVPLEDWREGLEKGKLLFELKGYKLHGKWTLVKIKKSERDWLLIKERDAYVRAPGDVFPEESVLSGLTVEEVKAGRSHGAQVRKALEAEGVPRGRLNPETTPLMLAEPADEAFTRDGWLFELKLDGYRLLACKSHGEALLLTRNGNDYTEVFPEVARAVKALPFDTCLIDGEVVVLDKTGKPQFSLLQQRGSISSALDVKRAAVELPAAFFVFDLLAFDDFDVRSLPLVRRKQLLAELIPKLGAVRYLDHIEREGEAFLDQVAALGLEGIIAKKADAPYRGGRIAQWLKIKAERTGDFVIVGFTEPEGHRHGLGALQLADYVNGSLVYAGRAGTGFNDACCRAARDARPSSCAVIRVSRPRTRAGASRARAIRFPRRAHDLDGAGLRRARSDSASGRRTASSGIRRFCACGSDKRRTTASGRSGASRPAPSPMSRSRTPWTMAMPHRIARRRTNRRGYGSYKALDPEDGQHLEPEQGLLARRSLHQGRPDRLLQVDLDVDPALPAQSPAGADAISRWHRREILLPEGRTGIRARVDSHDANLEQRHRARHQVLRLRRRGVARLHRQPRRDPAAHLGQPSRDARAARLVRAGSRPEGAPFSDVIRTAEVLHRICDAAGLPNYVKTTGKTGLHIMVPLGRQITYAQSRTLGELLARLVIRELGSIADDHATRHETRRQGVHRLPSESARSAHRRAVHRPPAAGGHGIDALTWDEVNSTLDPRAFTIRTALERMGAKGADPMLPVLGESPDLAKGAGATCGADAGLVSFRAGLSFRAKTRNRTHPGRGAPRPGR